MNEDGITLDPGLAVGGVLVRMHASVRISKNRLLHPPGRVDLLTADSKHKSAPEHRVYGTNQNVTCGQNLQRIATKGHPRHGPIGSGPFHVLGTVKTAAGARTSFFAMDKRMLLVTIPHRGSQRAEIRVYQPSQS